MPASHCMKQVPVHGYATSTCTDREMRVESYGVPGFVCVFLLWRREVLLHCERRRDVESSFRGLPPSSKGPSAAVRTLRNGVDRDLRACTNDFHAVFPSRPQRLRGKSLFVPAGSRDFFFLMRDSGSGPCRKIGLLSKMWPSGCVGSVLFRCTTRVCREALLSRRLQRNHE